MKTGYLVKLLTVSIIPLICATGATFAQTGSRPVIAKKDSKILVCDTETASNTYTWFRVGHDLGKIQLPGGNGRYYYWPGGIPADSIYFVVVGQTDTSYLYPLNQVESVDFGNATVISSHVDWYAKSIHARVVRPADNQLNVTFSLSKGAILKRKAGGEPVVTDPVILTSAGTMIVDYLLQDFWGGTSGWKLYLEFANPPLENPIYYFGVESDSTRSTWQYQDKVVVDTLENTIDIAVLPDFFNSPAKTLYFILGNGYVITDKNGANASSQSIQVNVAMGQKINLLLKKGVNTEIYTVSFTEIWCDVTPPAARAYNLNTFPSFQISTYYDTRPESVMLTCNGTSKPTDFGFVAAGAGKYNIVPTGYCDLPVPAGTGPAATTIELRYRRNGYTFTARAETALYNPVITLTPLEKQAYQPSDMVKLAWNSTQLYENKVDIALYAEGDPLPVKSITGITLQSYDFPLESNEKIIGKECHFKIQGAQSFNRQVSIESDVFLVEKPGTEKAIRFFGIEADSARQTWTLQEKFTVDPAEKNITVTVHPDFFTGSDIKTLHFILSPGYAFSDSDGQNTSSQSIDQPVVRNQKVNLILLKNNQFVRLVSVSFEEIWCTPILPQEKIFNLNVMPPFHIRSYYSRKPDRVSLSYAGSPAGELTFDFTSVGQDEYEITPSGILNVNLPVEMDSGQVFLQVEYNRLTRQNKPFAKDASLKVFNPRISFETLGKTQYHLAERVALVWNSTQLFERKVDLFLFEEGKPDPVWSSSNPLTAQTLEFELSEALGLKSGVNYYFRIRGSAEYNRVITAESGRFTVEVPGQLPSLEYFGFENQAPGLAGWEYTDTVPVIANGKITIRLEPWFYENDRCRIFFNATNYDQAILSWIQGGGSQSMPVVSQEEVERRDFTKFVLNGPVAGTKAEFQIEMIPVHYTPDKTTYVIFGTDNTILIKVRTNSTRIPKLLASGFGEYTGTVQHDSVGRYLAYTIPDARVAKPRVALKFTEAGMADMPYDLGVITITIPSIAFVYNSNWGQKDPVLKKYLLPAMNDFMLDFTTLSVDTVAVSIVKGDTVVSLLAGKWPVADGNNQFRVTAGSLAALQTDSVYRFQIEDAAGRAEKALSESFLVTRSLQDPFGRGDRHMRIIAAGGNGLAAIPDPDFFSGPVSITVTSLSGIVLGFGSVNPGEPFTIVQNCWDSGGQLLIIRCADKTGHVSVVKTFSKQ